MASKEDFEKFIEELANQTKITSKGTAFVDIGALLARSLLDIFESDPNFTDEMNDQIYRITDPEMPV